MTRNKNSELTRNTLLFAIGSFSTKFISFFLVPLYTYTLTTEEYGMVDILSTTIALLVPVISLNIQDAVLRFAFDKDYKQREVFSIAVKVIIAGSFLLGLALSILKSVGLIKLENKFLFFLWIVFALTSLSNSLQMFLKTKDKVKVVVLSGLASTAVTCISNVVLLFALKKGINGYLASGILGSAVSVGVCLVFGDVFKNFNLFRFDKALFKSMVKYSAPLILNSIAWWINSGSDKYILIYFKGISEEGVYAIASKIPSILSVFQTIFYNAWAISAIRDFDEKDTDGYIGNTYKLYSLASIVGCSLLIVVNPFLSLVLYKNDFFEAYKYAPLLLVGAMLNGMALFEGCLYAAAKRTTVVTYTTLIGAAFNISLNLILIPYTGALGAAMATMIGYIFVWISRSVYLHKFIRIKYNWTIQIVSIILILLQVVAFELNFSFASQIIVFVTLFSIQTICSREAIKSFFQSLKKQKKKLHC